MPPVVRHFAETHPDSVRLLGFLGHRQALEAQRAAHVLVNIANADPSQIPGKFNEYLGAARPVLHIAADGGQDLAAAFVQRTGRGWVVENDRQQIGGTLNPATRFFVFDTEPDLERLIPPLAGAPLPPQPPVTTVAAAIDRVFQQALGRPPTAAEREIAAAALRDPAHGDRPSPQGLADLLWSVTMKPEFQLIR